MINAVIRFALNHRLAVIMASVLIVIYGLWIARDLPIDVFPDLNRPRVVIMSEAHGLAPEEVETLVTVPIEAVVNGTPGLTDIRSSSGIGLSIVYAEFDWATDIYRARQMIAERLQQVRGRLPKDVEFALAPINSIMGEIQFLSLASSDQKFTPMELRSIADWTVRPALMGIKGIGQINVMGGEVKQFQILLNLKKMNHKQLTIEEVRQALRDIGQNTTGGVLVDEDREYLIRPISRVSTVSEIENTVVGMQFGRPILLKEIATVQIGAQEARGTASVDGSPAVILTVQKQPDIDTVSLTKEVEAAVVKIQKSLPNGVKIRSDLFKQATFIQHAINNVSEALRDGSAIVAVVLFAFLLNFRTTLISLTAIPVSFVVTLIFFKIFDLSINTMTLGGLAIAVGELVDDAIVDVENVFRRLRQNYALGLAVHPLRVVYEASKEIRNSLVVSTLLVIVVFVPLFALSAIEGRFFRPLGIAYVVSLFASLIVSISLTPVLCYLLLPNSQAIRKKDETFSIRWIKHLLDPLVVFSINRPYIPISISALLLGCAVFAGSRLGRDFLPKFNEGTATIGVAADPGISLSASDALGQKIEKAILSVSGVRSTVRRTGRAEMDEHAEGVHWSEIDVDFSEKLDRKLDIILDEIRNKIQEVSDVYINIGQPISHRIDHMMSGVRAEIAIKVFGNDFVELRRLAVDIEEKLKAVPGLVDIQIEPSITIPQVAIGIDRYAASRQGIVGGSLAEDIESLLAGEAIANIFEDQRKYDIVLRTHAELRDRMEKFNDLIVGKNLLGESIALGKVADIYETEGPNQINRDGLLRRTIISANTSGRSLSEIAEDIKNILDRKISFPEGYYYAMGGQFESERSARLMISILGFLSIFVILLILYSNFNNIIPALIVLVNIPLALIGSIAAIYIAGLNLSLAALVAFVTLCGIASRNGLLMMNHYLFLRSRSPELDVINIIRQGTMERLIPVLMTAGTGILALVPLLLSRDAPGKEILYPVAVVIVGGLFSSTVLNTFVTPALVCFLRSSVFVASEKVLDAEILA